MLEKVEEVLVVVINEAKFGMKLPCTLGADVQ